MRRASTFPSISATISQIVNMTLKEMKKREREEMNPVRYTMKYLWFPIVILLIVAAVVAAVLVGVFVKPWLWCLLPSGVAVALLVGLIVINAVVARKELETELSRWAYLFQSEDYPSDIIETEDPETGIQYVLSEKGLRYVLPIECEQVFDEVKENEFFLPWSDVEIVVASDNFARRVRLAFAVVDVSKRSVDGEYLPGDNELHFLPLEQELADFFRKYGLDKRLSVEWRYIQIQPKDAFKQILSRGYIRTLLGEDGKRVRRERADDLYAE